MHSLHHLALTTAGRILLSSGIRKAAAIALGPVVADSRDVVPGDVYWALQESHGDGAGTVEDAFRRGAQGVVASQVVAVPDDRWALLVDEPQRALQQWARWKRRQFSGTLIAVAGSVGKTTARQMIHTVLRSQLKGTASPKYRIHRWGVPLSMLAMEAEHDYAVLELGASGCGEIASLAEMCAPKVGVITRIGDAQLNGFDSRHGASEAKAELLAALPSSGHAVLADDSWLRTLAARCAAPITWIGTGPQCCPRATDVDCQQGRLEFHLDLGETSSPVAGSRNSKKPVRFKIPVWGRHHIQAALAAISIGRMLGFDLDDIAAALTKYDAVPLRCDVLDIRGATIINDTDNASPTAMHAALELLRDFDVPGRRIVICGDLAERGPQSIALHWRMGKDIVQVGGAELVIACGQFARHVTSGARSTGLIRSCCVPCDTVEQALPFVAQAILSGDVVLVKGSRVMAMERVIDAMQPFSREGALRAA